MESKSIAEIENAVKELSPHELKEFRKWFFNFDQDMWDAQLQSDIHSGKLDALAKEALNEFNNGKTTSL